ncbi:Tat pathway signal sequence domain protein [Streptomyces caniscabiei]|uniref:Tat pathway signal sequence domain protein n=1 Tax=Streptomyces caniscabiei TaxID=2746961 RepID=UPI001CE0A1DA|nr:Tat pathway signal sequence domain protein [Streptomyces caniscabiei]MDX3510120.1 Tat pathway signal sequence domain protein [Streptomyces caniscabiei]MDX3720883.1 Tat pathway signal sequence domain protein [Streptomyces caniscabiei]MDX3729048.1 Tat pathway signal sequence domain protein [Streptomyces caniscabiei]WEO27738.1 Tat pathway signal sequence domain protein [Streptomyces caniscabiei]
MSGVGPVEPGEGTRAWEAADGAADADTPPPPGPPRGRYAQVYARHRRAVLAGAAAVVALVGGGYLYATRPASAPTPEPTPREAPYPSQAVVVSYLGPVARSARTPRGRFAFEMELGVRHGPPITVERMTQPYEGLSLRTDPRTPLRIGTKETRKIVITMRVIECGKAPENAGLPFLDVTLRNTRAIEAHSFILGERYAQDLSDALRVACGNDSASLPKG